MDIAELRELRQIVSTAAGPTSFVDTGGDGPVALFIHGIATNAALWRRPIARLRHERRCIAVDLPLHGRSPASPDQDITLTGLADFVSAFCDALDLEEVDVVSNDTGGAIAQVLAVRDTARLRSLVLTNCDTEGNMPPRAFMGTVRLARARLLAPVLRSLRANVHAARRQVFSSGYQDVTNQPLEVTAEFLAPVIESRASARLFQRWVAGLSDAELKSVGPGLAALEVPTLMVWGTGDPFFATRWAHRLHEQIPGSRGVVEVPDGKLFFPDERPDDLVAALSAFWGSLAPPSPAAPSTHLPLAAATGGTDGPVGHRADDTVRDDLTLADGQT